MRSKCFPLIVRKTHVYVVGDGRTAAVPSPGIPSHGQQHGQCHSTTNSHQCLPWLYTGNQTSVNSTLKTTYVRKSIGQNTISLCIKLYKPPVHNDHFCLCREISWSKWFNFSTISLCIKLCKPPVHNK